MAVKKTPLVSIVMNCYNGEAYLREAVESVLRQTYRNWEVVFWDNQSNDKSAEIIKSFGDSRINYHLAEKKTVLYNARNLALEKCEGEFIAFLDVDDWWEKDKLKRQVDVFLADSSLAAVYSNYWRYFQKNGLIKAVNRNKENDTRGVNDFLVKYDCGILTLMLKKCDLVDWNQKVFDDRYNLIGDFDLVLRLSLEKRFYYINEPLAFYRDHEASESKKSYIAWASEFTIWDRENKDKFSAFSGYHNICNAIKFYNLMDAKYSNKFLAAVRHAVSRPIGISTAKFIIISILPLRLTKMLVKLVNMLRCNG